MLPGVRFSPWLPVLLLLALAAYLLPATRSEPRPWVLTPTPQGATAPHAPETLPGTLPPETLRLFQQTRPAAVRVLTVARSDARVLSEFGQRIASSILRPLEVLYAGLNGVAFRPADLAEINWQVVVAADRVDVTD